MHRSSHQQRENINFYGTLRCLKQRIGLPTNERNKVITYASRQLKEDEKNYTTHDFELEAVILHLRVGDTNYMVRKSGRYGVLARSNMAYRGYLAWALRLLYSRIFFNRLLIRRIDASGYGVLGYSHHGFDQSFIYGISADVDTTYSSKSGNGLEFV
ncbi:putative reverse transcriptase domain-containing protein [Tanacetum coccineum]